MEPEEDFLNWSMIITQCVEPGGEYSYLISDYCRLVEDICNFSSLRGELEQYTNMFLDETVPIATRKVLELTFLYQEEKTKVLNFLLSSAKIAVWYFCNDKLDKMSEIIGVFDKKSTFYAKNKIYNGDGPYNKLVPEIINQGLIDTMAVNLSKESVTGKHFELFFKAIYDDEFLSVQIKCSQIIMQMINFIDSNRGECFKLQDTIADVLEIAFNLKDADQLTNKFLTLGENLLREDKLNYQLVGAKILSEIKNSYKGLVKESFKEWTATTTIGEFLVKQDLNPTLLKTIEPVLAAVLNAKSLQKLWKDAFVAHSSQKSEMLAIVAKALKTLDIEQSKVFIDEAINEPSKETIDFLMETFKSAQKNEELALYILSKLIPMEGMGKRIAESITNEMSVKVKKSIAQECINVLSTQNIENACFILNKLASSYYSVKEIFPINFTGLLINFIRENPEKKPPVIPILFTYIKNTSKIIDSNVINRIAQTGEDDSLWRFLNQSYSELKIKAIDEKAYETLFKIISRQDFSKATLEFANLCNNALFYNAFIQGIMQKSGNGYYNSYVTFALPNHFEIMENLLIKAEDKSVGQVATNFIDLIYETSNRKIDVLDRMLKLFKQEETLFAKKRIMHTFFRPLVNFTAYFFPTDYDVIPHNMDKFTGHKKVYINIDGYKKLIQIPPYADVDNLKYRIGTMTNKAYYQISLYIGKDKLTNEQLKELKDFDTITGEITNDSYNYSQKENDPYYRLISINFEEEVYKLLDADDISLQGLAYSFLCILPNPKSAEDLLNDIDKFVEMIKDVSSIKKTYLFEIAIKKVKEDEEYCKEFVNKTTDLLFDGLLDKFLQRVSLKLINCGFDECFKPYMEKTVPVLLKSVLSVPLAVNSIEVLGKFQSIEPKTTEVLFRNKDLLINAIQFINDEFWNKFKECLETLPPEPLFEICIKKINEGNKENQRFSELFVGSIKKASDEVDLSEILSRCVDILKTAKRSVFSGLFTIINSILIKKQSEITKYQYLAKDLINLTLTIDDEGVQESLFNLLETLRNNDWSLLQEVCTLKTDSWSIDPSMRRKSDIGLTGLRNLGATCYMNSVLQQLASVKPFVANVIDAKLEKEGQKELQELFTSMNLSLVQYSDTEPFSKNWLAWGKQPINTKEQQDAVEFYQLILDQLPDECNKLFKGSIRNTMKGVTEEKFESHNDESFYSIPLDVKGCKNIEESFNVFKQSEMFEGYKAEGFSEPIDIQKYSRIEKAPPVLVLQLKRFEYDLETFNRVKINDEFEFKESLDISPLMVNSEEPVIYKLHGIVLHRGTAEGGHYTSLVKNGKDYILYNDRDVREFPASDIKQEAYGNSKDNQSAYLLFYTAVDFKDEAVIKFDEETKEKIQKENEEFINQQCRFSKQFFRCATQHIDPILYLVNIFAHSKLVEEVPVMEVTLHNFLEDGKTENINYAADYFINNIDDVIQIFINCSRDEITKCVLFVITRIITNAAQEKADKLCELFIDNFAMIINVRRQIPLASQVIYQFTESHKESASLMKIDDKINNIIELIYSVSRSVMFFETTNISKLLETLSLLDEFNFSAIYKYAEAINLSVENRQVFMKLYMRLVEENKVELEALISRLLLSECEGMNDTVVELIADALVAKPESLREMYAITEENNITNAVLYKLSLRIHANDKAVKDMFMNDLSFLTGILVLGNPENASDTLNIIYSLFPEIDEIEYEEESKSDILIAEDREQAFREIYSEVNKAISYIIENSVKLNSEKIVIVYMSLIKLLNLTEDENEYKRAYCLLSVTLSVFCTPEVALQCVECLFVFKNSFIEKDILTLILQVCSYLEVNDRKLMTFFDTFFFKCKELGDEILEKYLSCKLALSAVDKFINDNNTYVKKHMAKCLYSCSHIDTEAALRFIELFFTEKIFNNFESTADVFSGVLLNVGDKISEEGIINYAKAFIDLIYKRALSPGDIDFYQFEVCVDAYKVLRRDTRWFGRIDLRKVEKFPVVIRYTTEDEAACKLALFVVFCLPLLNIDNVYNICMGFDKENAKSKNLCSLLVIILECILMRDGDDKKGVVLKYYQDIENPVPFINYAAQKITYGTKWHIEIAKDVLTYDYTKGYDTFITNSLSTLTNFDSYVKDLSHYKRADEEWIRMLKKCKH